MADLFMVPRLKDRLLTTLRDLSTGLGLELRLMREWWAVEPKLLLLLLKANEGDWPPPPSPSLALLWLRKKWEEEGETGEEMGVAEEKDGRSSTSSMSKDLFSASKSDKIPSRWSFTESSDILTECRRLRDAAPSQMR